MCTYYQKHSLQPTLIKMSPFTPLVFLGLFLYVTAVPDPEPVFNPSNQHKILRPTYKPYGGGPTIIRPTYRPGSGGQFIRVRRSPDDDWIFRPDLGRDDRGNTRGTATVEKHGDDYDINAQFGQTFRGPDKHSETWHVGGSFRW
ncbi:hypothetical protein GWI33_018090 [Rhynchophorus ferrugineus]|uniref:Coleoptericin n=1 Tax=Rhynchophorus ferrugineus TaxID=354439 RepID=A0A834M2X2_RHYFE|nr:hypothetical protein GWI33_018090 [Rhynchophorus ferrugineus]WAQ69872.1 coleoptericin [Rhynchophorus ferrugineus]